MGLVEVEQIDETPRGTSLHHFASNELLIITFCSRVFAIRVGEQKLLYLASQLFSCSAASVYQSIKLS